MERQVVTADKCRTCFGQTKGLHSLKILAVEEPPGKLSYANLLKEVANINIADDENNDLPQYICVCCSRKLKLSHAFIKQAQEVDKKLWGQLNQNQTLDCLEESEIDIQKCLEIKLESEADNEEHTAKDVQTAAACDQYSLQIKTQFAEEVSESNIAKEVHLINAQNIDDIHLEESNDLDGTNSTQDSVEFSQCDTDDNEVLSSIAVNKQSKHEIYNGVDNRNVTKKVYASTPDHILQKKLTQIDKDTDIAVPCRQCNKIFNNSKELIRHLRNTHVPEDRKCACPVCGAKFTRSCNMYKHMRTLHEPDSVKMLLPTKDKTHECEKCHRKYTKKKHLNYHIKIKHDKDSDTSESNLREPKKGLKKTSEVRPLCFICGGSFSNKAHLIVHMRRHTGEKPFKCDLCDRAFPRISDLTCHRRIHTGEKPYKCKICEKTFRVSTKLATHMRSHTDDRPYKCSQCERSFKYSKDLNIHTRIHTGERPYCCTVCGSTFTQSNSLKAHRMKLNHIENIT